MIEVVSEIFTVTLEVCKIIIGFVTTVESTGVLSTLAASVLFRKKVVESVSRMKIGQTLNITILSRVSNCRRPQEMSEMSIHKNLSIGAG